MRHHYLTIFISCKPWLEGERAAAAKGNLMVCCQEQKDVLMSWEEKRKEGNGKDTQTGEKER
jgi:hypothetical protein